MSVEKFIVSKEDSGYTIFPNKVLQGLQKYPTALGVWCSLASLPQQWEFYKDKIYSDLNIGRDKLKKIFEILEKCNLVVITQLRNSQGRFGEWSLHVKNGTDFLPFTENTSTVESPFTDLPLTANQSLVNSTYKRKIEKETKIEKKQKSFLKNKAENAKKHNFAQSMNQMAHEQKKIEEHEMHKRSRMPEELKNKIVNMKKVYQMHEDIVLWSINDVEFSKLCRLIWRLKFYPEGNLYPNSNQKLILQTMLVDFTKYGMSNKSDQAKCKPLYHHDIKFVEYKYKEIASLCSMKTIKTFKKYLRYLELTGFIAVLYSHKSFKVRIIHHRILNSPVFKDEELYD